MYADVTHPLCIRMWHMHTHCGPSTILDWINSLYTIYWKSQILILGVSLDDFDVTREKWLICKQWRPLSDAALCTVWQILFWSLQIKVGHYKNTPIWINRKFHLQKLKKKLWYLSYFCSKHRFVYSLEPPRRGGSNEYTQSMFLIGNKKKYVTPVNPSFTI